MIEPIQLNLGRGSCGRLFFFYRGAVYVRPSLFSRCLGEAYYRGAVYVYRDAGRLVSPWAVLSKFKRPQSVRGPGIAAVIRPPLVGSLEVWGSSGRQANRRDAGCTAAGGVYSRRGGQGRRPRREGLRGLSPREPWLTCPRQVGAAATGCIASLAERTGARGGPLPGYQSHLQVPFQDPSQVPCG